MAEPGIEVGDLRTRGASLAGVKVASVSLRENELHIALKRAGKAPAWTLRLRGIIAFKDDGVQGKELAGYAIEDRGSFKEIRFRRRSGKLLLRCEYMEGDVAWAEPRA